MKLLSILTSCAILSLCVSPIAKAGDIIRLDRSSALESATKLEVTPQGLVIDFGVLIGSTIISHKSNIVYSGVDGVLCTSKANCEDENPPTILFVRKIPQVDFKDEEAMPNGTSMLYVDTEVGMYRFEFNPSSSIPKYTKVEIQEEIPLLSEQNR